jgi:hypothetical protein
MAKSHVIPTSLYGNSLNDTLGPAKIVSDVPGKYSRKTLTGIYETNVVCHECEAMFSPWDDYANKLLIRTEPDKIMGPQGELGAYVYQNVNYKLLKLFFVSLLWRAHHATHDMFSAVKVGRKFEKNLRNMITTGIPGAAETFAVVVARFDHDLADGFFHSFHERYDGVGVYRISFSRHAAYVKVSSRDSARFFKPMILSPDQTFRIIARDFQSSNELGVMRELIGKIGKL